MKKLPKLSAGGVVIWAVPKGNLPSDPGFPSGKDQTCCKEINVWGGKHLWSVMLGRHLEVFLAKQFWASCCLTRTSTSHSVVPCGILRILWYRGIMVCCGILWVLWYTVVFSGYLESRVRLLSSLSIRGACVASHSSSSLLKYTKTSTKTKTQRQERRLKHKDKHKD